LNSLFLSLSLATQNRIFAYAYNRTPNSQECLFSIRSPMKSDNAFSLLTERAKRGAERADQNWFILIENATRSRRINLGLASHACTCVYVHTRARPRSPNVYRIRGSVIITASHIRARAPEFIYSNLFTFTRDDSTTQYWPRPATPGVHTFRVYAWRRVQIISKNVYCLFIKILDIIDCFLRKELGDFLKIVNYLYPYNKILFFYKFF